MFILPGVVCALIITEKTFDIDLIIQILIGLLATGMVASSNYVINEWLDADFDRYHPIKKNRSLVIENVTGKII